MSNQIYSHKISDLTQNYDFREIVENSSHASFFYLSGINYVTSFLSKLMGVT